MTNKRKYPEVKGYWVYSIKIKSVGKYYIGVSGYKKCSQRFAKNKYETCSLEPYLDEWESMEKTVIQDGFLTKEEAFKMEDDLIQELRFKDLCINKQRSGLIKASDKNAYKRELRKNNTEYRERQNQQVKQWRLDNPEYRKQRYKNNVEYQEQEKQRSKQYYENNKEKINEKRRQRYQKKKLEKQQNQTSLPL